MVARPPVAPARARAQSTSPCENGSPSPATSSSPAGKSPRRFLRRLKTTTSVERPPCDFSGMYRGWHGSEKINVRLERTSDGRLSGVSHYDTPTGTANTVSGRVSANGTFTLRLHGGVQVKGTCDHSNGFLIGTFSGAAGQRPFRLFPKPAGYPAVFQYERTQVSTTCKASVVTLGYFGGSASVNEAATNALVPGVIPVKLPGFDVCDPPPFDIQVISFVQVYGPGYLTSEAVRFSGPFHANPRPYVVVDLSTGKRVEFGDMITDAGPLERIAPGCIDDAIVARSIADLEEVEAPSADYGSDPCSDYPHHARLWFCGPVPADAPAKWVPTSEGMAIDETFIVSWSVLKRIGVLAPNAPFRHLWGAVKPAGPDVEPCTARLAMDAMGTPTRLIRWEYRVGD